MDSVLLVFVALLLLVGTGHSESESEIPEGAATLAFVFDSTGSMFDDLRQVKDGAAKIMATMLERKEKPIYNYVLVPFHDPGQLAHCMVFSFPISPNSFARIVQ